MISEKYLTIGVLHDSESKVITTQPMAPLSLSFSGFVDGSTPQKQEVMAEISSVEEEEVRAQIPVEERHKNPSL